MRKDSRERDADPSYNPQRALWQAVLQHAVEDAMLGTGSISSASNKEQLIRDTYTTRAWLTKSNPDFITVCQLAGLDPEAVAQHMRKRLANAPSPEELVSNGRPPKPKPPAKPKRPTAPTHYTLNGETLTIQQWAARAGIAPATIQSRIRKGWPIADALTTRRGQHNPYVKAWRRGSPPVTITHAGMTLTIQQWADRTGLTVDRIKSRRAKGWPIERVLATGDLRTKAAKTQEAEA